MRVFLTGGTGYVGSAVLDALVRHGHHVDVLVRNSEAAARVQARGAQAIVGDLLHPGVVARRGGGGRRRSVHAAASTARVSARSTPSRSTC